jgi:hypothetical protein
MISAFVCALEVDRGDAEVVLLAELGLDYDQRHAYARQLSRVWVPQLMGSEPPAYARCDHRSAQLIPPGRAGPVATARRAADDAEQRPDGKREPRFEPGLKLGPSPGVHADLAAASALAATDPHGAPALIEVSLGKSEGFLDAQPGPPEDYDQPAQPAACASSPAARMTAMISSTFGGSAGYRSPCCAAADRRGSRAWSPATDVDRHDRTAAQT